MINGILQLARRGIDRYLPHVGIYYRNVRDRRMLGMEPALTPLGFKFIGNKQMQSGGFEPEETAVVASLLDDADVFVNIGANIGYYCCAALSRGKQTIAFEPIETNLQYLMTNIVANGWEKNVEIFPIALADYVGVTTIYGGGTGASLIAGWSGTPKRYRRWVPADRLDNILEGRLQGRRVLVIMDVEGAELLILRHARVLLTQNPKPVWMVEICVGEHQPEGITVNPKLLDTFEVFWDAGYVAYTANEERKLVTHQQVAEVQRTGADTLGTHNFVFVGRPK